MADPDEIQAAYTDGYVHACLRAKSFLISRKFGPELLARFADWMDPSAGVDDKPV